MNSTKLQIAFNVDVSHSYFKNNICNCLQYNYGPVTKALAGRFDLSIRKRVSGFGFYINTRGSLNSFLQYAGATTGQTYFDFDISSITQAFNFFTESPAGWLGAFVYDSNSALNIISGGMVQLVADKSPGPNTSAVAVLRVHFIDMINNGPMHFTINYDARATQWQYFIINNSAVPLPSPSISGKTPINFTGPENVTMETGQQAMLFTSGDSLLPLSEIPVYRFNLVNTPEEKSGKPPSPAKVVCKGLPNPDPLRIGSVANGDTIRVISPMYVYL